MRATHASRGVERGTVDSYRAGVRMIKSDDQAGECRFAAARFADDAERLTASDGEGDTIDGPHQMAPAAKCFVNVVDDDHGGVVRLLRIRFSGHTVARAQPA